MIKRVIIVVIIAVFVLTMTFLSIGIASKTRRNNLLSDRIKALPSFTFQKLDNEFFNSSDIKEGPVLIIRFHPECEHCKYEISELMNSKILLPGLMVLLVSSAAPDSIREFIRQFNFDQYPGVITMVDTSHRFGDIFGTDIVPSNFIYDKNLDLVKVLYGEVKTETILKYMLKYEDN